MPLPTATEYAALIDAAGADGYAIPAVNVTSTETLNGAMRGFAEARADGHRPGHHRRAGSSRARGRAALGARALADTRHELVERYPVAVALHTDHAPPDASTLRAPLIDDVTERAAARGGAAV